MKNAIIKSITKVLATAWVWSLILFVVLGIPSLLIFLSVGLFRWAFL